MKLESLDSYKKDTGNFKLFASIVVAISLSANVLLYVLSRNALERAHEHIWIVDKDYRPYRAVVRPHLNYAERVYEYEEAVREFYENAFSCDDSHITGRGESETLERALHLSNYFVSGQTVADLWAEENITGNVLENSWTYRGRVDSVLFDLDRSPVKGYVFGKQTIRMRRQTITRNMHITFTLYDMAQRTRLNPFAVKLDALDIFNNTVIESDRH